MQFVDADFFRIAAFLVESILSFLTASANEEKAVDIWIDFAFSRYA